MAIDANAAAVPATKRPRGIFDWVIAGVSFSAFG
jgi:hypothetical protein